MLDKTSKLPSQRITNLKVNQKNIFFYAGVAVLLFLFCYRIWDLGITHHDDAIWYVAALQGKWSVITQFAVRQGRIWAFISGALMYGVFHLQGSITGNIIWTGSLAVFFVLFYYVIFIYFGQRIALMAATLNLSLFAMRWEGSIITAYPAFAWILSSLFLLSVGLGWYYAHNGRPLFLYASFITLFVSFWIHEGMSVLFSVLYILSSIANYYNVQKNLSSILSIFRTRTSRFQLIGAVVVIGIYFTMYLVFRLVFPSNYAGNTFGGGNIIRLFPTLLGLSTSGSVLSDLFRPYSVRFHDITMQDHYSITYSISSYLHSVTDNPSAVLTAVVVFLMVYFLPRFNEHSKHQNMGLLTSISVLVGVLIAFVPILPIALIEKYQTHYSELNIRSYAFTAFSHFGITLGISSLVLRIASFKRFGTIFRNGVSVLLAITVALLAFCGNKMNDAIVNDIRVEASRWKVIDQTMEIVSQHEESIQSLYAPRLYNGSWFTVLDPIYWAQYISARYGKTIEFSRDIISAPSLEHTEAYMDYTLARNGLQPIIIFAPLSKLALDNSVITKEIIVAIKDADQSDIEQYILSFQDRQRGFVAIRFSDLDLFRGNETIRIMRSVAAVPASIRVDRYSIIHSLPVRCDSSFTSGTILFFGNEIPDQEPNSCLGDFLLQDGWNSRGRIGTWSKMQEAAIAFPTKGFQQGPLTLTLQVGTLTGLGYYDIPQTLTVRAGNVLLATRTDEKDDGLQPLQIQIPNSLWKQGDDIILSIEVDPIVNPAKEKLSNDTRNLGVYLESFKIETIKDDVEFND